MNSLQAAGLKKLEAGERLSVQGYKIRIRKGLRYLRRCRDPYHLILQEVKRCIKQSKLPLSAVSTNEAELEKFRIENHKSLAKIYLEYMRKGENLDLFVIYLRDEVKKGDFSLVDIGTSKKELVDFCPWIPGNLTLP